MMIKTISMIVLTILMYLLAIFIQKKLKIAILHPALVSSIAIICVLLILGYDYDDYMVGGHWIYDFLNCTVVCLAYPLYLYRDMIVKHFRVILTSVLVGILTNIVLVFTTLKILGYSKEIIASLLPRSITAAVGIQVSEQIGGVDTLTVLFIMLTGLIGSMLGHYLVRLANFQTSIAKGLTFGNASHAIGTAKILETDIESAAFSSIGMILTALLSSVILPLFILFIY
ncbi:LrgB family protein [Mammaliicoccus lentus]|jgi:predicted murein hydrolase (TIGR00659 family)|uniref:LrgB family protein n=1 Tax=Mammaliicoccus lentus TaxID=42858 RepID=UPI0002E4B90D|nr:LrgB family protein [Mammaliicoccus lentus]MCD2476720.1 LrgB family protein [Mammaliicoccus lentus]MCD2519841.1 LrgB family protein [Mammaliicoccus lentus]MEB5686528.1 LrgB family protein [Mammaliicoccus lentus]WQL56330.1 LrgB family protein [Mammaliicoccus lentus]SCU30837.1 holin-like protein [Mammaliicoccus lentus]